MRKEKDFLRNPVIKNRRIRNALDNAVNFMLVLGALVAAGSVGACLGSIASLSKRQKEAERISNIVREYEKEKAKSDAVNIDSLINQHVR